MCRSKRASTRGSCGGRVIVAGVNWIVVERGSREVDWGGAGVIQAGGTGGFGGLASYYQDYKTDWWLVMELQG